MPTVLVVDRSKANRRLLHTLLSLKGHDVVEADDGAQALDVARRTAPAVVVTDLAPDGAGDEAVRRLREDPATAAIPVVAYGGGDAGPDLRPVAAAYRVNRLVGQPADPGALLEAIDSLIAERATLRADPAARLATDPTARQATGRAGPDAPWLPGTPDDVRLVFDAAPVGVVLGTADGAATYVNPGLARITGVPAPRLLGDGWLNRLGAHGRRETLRAIAGEASGAVPDRPGADRVAGDRSAGDRSAADRTGGDATWRCRDRVSRSGRPPQWLDLTVRHIPGGAGRPAGFAAFIADVTAEVAGADGGARDGDQAATRLGTLRRFAAGVAHGYNNALAAVLSYGEFLRDRIGDAQADGRVDRATGHELLKDVETILAAGRRANELTRLLQSFGQRGRPPTPTVVDLNTALAPGLAAVRGRLGSGIDLRVELADELRPVVADPDQLGQILRHLVDNAREAMPHGGTLEIRTAADPGPADPAGAGTADPATAAGSAPPERVRLTVRDTGAGMSPAVAQRALEPFFTTKADAEAAGLGLTAVSGMVDQAGGELVVETAPGAGTAVHVLFPVAAPTGDRPPGAPAAPHDAAETVVVVDDEEPVRSLVHRILTRAGYHVLTADSAAEALAVVRSYPGPVHCLLTDLAMPGMPGTELTRRLRAERPELAVLYMSGYAEPLLHHLGTADDRANLLPKPFSRGELLTTVRATIHEHRAARPR